MEFHLILYQEILMNPSTQVNRGQHRAAKDANTASHKDLRAFMRSEMTWRGIPRKQSSHVGNPPEMSAQPDIQPTKRLVDNIDITGAVLNKVRSNSGEISELLRYS